MGGELAVSGAEGVLGRVLAWLDVAKHVRREMFCYVEAGQDTTKYAFCATDGQLAAHGFVDAIAAYAWVCYCSGDGLRRSSEKNIYILWGQGQGWWHMSCGGIACG